MKLSDFILLGTEEKKDLLLHEGVLIAKRSGTGLMIFLFQLPEYYVETYCNVDNRQIQEFRVFHNDLPLTPYLDAISLDGLLRQ